MKRIATLCLAAAIVGIGWQELPGHAAPASARSAAGQAASTTAFQRIMNRAGHGPRTFIQRPVIAAHRQADSVSRAPAGQSVSSMRIDIASWDPGEATVDADTIADNNYADNHYFRSNHSTSYAVLGRTTGYYEFVDFSGTLLAHYQGSIFNSESNASAAFNDAQNTTRGIFTDPNTGRPAEFADCSSIVNIPCEIVTYFPIVDNVDSYEIYTVLQYKQCMAETTSTAPEWFTNDPQGLKLTQDLAADMDAKAAVAVVNTCGTSGPKPTVVVPTSPPVTIPTISPPPSQPTPKPTSTSVPPTATPIPQPSIRIQSIEVDQGGHALSPAAVKSGVASTFKVSVALANPGSNNPSATITFPNLGGTNTFTMSRTSFDANSAEFSYETTLHTGKKSKQTPVDVHVSLGMASDDNSTQLTIKSNCKKNKKGKKVCK